MLEHGLQFTPFGVIKIGDPIPVQPTGDTAGATARVEAPRAEAPRVVAAPMAPALRPDKPLDGREIARLVKARIKAIDTILRGVPALQAERAQLAALLLAASPRKPKRQPAGGAH